MVFPVGVNILKVKSVRMWSCFATLIKYKIQTEINEKSLINFSSYVSFLLDHECYEDGAQREVIYIE